MSYIRMLILTADQAATVRGATSSGAILNPRLMDAPEGVDEDNNPTYGKYVLPLAVMIDPAHSMWWTYFLALPQANIDPEVVFLPVEE